MIAAHPAPPPALVAPLAGAERVVAISDTAVTPTDLVVPPQTAVTWRNLGRNRHTVTADAGAFDSGSLLSGREFSIQAPREPGVYSYHCSFHAYIRGSVTVSLISLAPLAPIPFGAGARLSGSVPAAPPGTPVTIERRIPGAWQVVASAVTDANAAFSAQVPALSGPAAFRALSGTSVSPALRVAVRPDLMAERRGARLRAHVRPALAHAAVTLERLDLDRYLWRTVGRGHLSGSGQVSFPLRVPGVYRVAVPASARFAAAASAPIQFRPARYHD